MARTSRKTASLKITRAAHKRFSYEFRSGCSSRAAAIAFKAVNEQPVFVEDEDGHMMRQWKKEELQSYTQDDIKNAIRGRHAVETEDMLEWIPPSAIKYSVTKGWLATFGAGIYRVTRKAAAELDLPRSVGGRKIAFYDAGLV
jgi:hypothetical protein